MGFRFRRSVKLLPGVRLNVSTRGVSTSIGGPGATLNIGRRGTRATVGIPGTGLSYSTKLSGPAARSIASSPGSTQQARPPSTAAAIISWIAIAFMLFAVGTCMFGRDGPPARFEASTVATMPALPGRTVAAQNVNCRSAPTDGAVLAQLDRGMSVKVVEQARGWTKIARPGTDCWVSDTLLK